MKRITTTLFLIVLLGTLCQAGDWQNIAPDARGVGMGGARVAISNGAYSSFWNPASIARRAELSTTTASLYGAIQYNYIGFSPR